MSTAMLIGAARRTCSRSLSSTAARSTSLPAARDWNHPLCLHPHNALQNARALSTKEAPSSDEADPVTKNKRQPFATDEIEPGEWDADLKDPLHRPKYKSRARIISKEDYANQPSVSFEQQYDSFADAMVTLSWMDHDTQRRIYDLYLNWMTTAQETHGKTSHEYVCRLLGQRFNITPFRAAAICQLQHNEEQYKLNEPDRILCTEEAKIMDAYMKHTITEAYRSTGEVPPESFVEPVDSEAGKESYKTIMVDDLMDVDQLTRDANVREQERARLMINDHVYIEDKDDETQEIKLSRDAKRLMKQKEQLNAKKKEAVSSPTAEEAVKQMDERRPRWKFVAQTINTQDLNPKSKFSHYKDGKMLRGRRHRMRFQQDWPENTLIEEDGELRPANLAEVKQTSWKPIRHVQEFTYERLKKGWLDRTVRNKSNAWGKKPILAEKETPKAISGNEEDDNPEAAEGDEANVEATKGDEADVEATEAFDSDSGSSDSDSGSSDSSSSDDDDEAIADEESSETDDTDAKKAAGADDDGKEADKSEDPAAASSDASEKKEESSEEKDK